MQLLLRIFLAIFGKRNKINKLKVIGVYFQPYKKWLYLVLFAIILSSSSVLLISKCIRYTIDYGFATANHFMINRTCLILLCLVITLTVGAVIRSYFICYVGDKVMLDIRRDIYRSILTMSAAEFETKKHGALLSILMNDTDTMRNIISNSVSSALRNLIMVIGGFVMMFTTSIKLTLITMLSLPILILPIIIVGTQAKRSAKEDKEFSDELFIEAENSLDNIQLIQSYSREVVAEEKFEKKQQDLFVSSKKHALLRAFLVSTVMLIAFTGIVMLLWFCGREVIAGRISSGAVSSFLLLLLLCGAALGAVADSAQEIGKLLGICENIATFFISCRGNSVPNSLLQHDENTIYLTEENVKDISINNVNFFYQSKPQLALDEISFKLPNGKVTALVGESGAGKSTIIKMILKFYTPDSGNITFGDIDIQNVPCHLLRNHMAYVSQDSYIFSDTIYNNILYGDLNASAEDIEKAAEAAAVMGFIERMPDGLHTFVGEKGVRLSGGQKQRICIARALLRNPRILLLDEATSALDNYNERKVHEALTNLMQNRTTLVVAHRLSTIINADHIIVMKYGSIVQEGNHKSLIEIKNGEYYRLLNSGLLDA